MSTVQKKRRTSLDRAIEAQRELEQEICGIWARAARRGTLFADILKEITSRVWESPRLKKQPGHVRQYLFGVSSACLQMAHAWQTANVWIHDGIAYANHLDNLPEHVRGLIRKDQLHLVTIWSDSASRFTDKPADSVKIFSDHKAL